MDIDQQAIAKAAGEVASAASSAAHVVSASGATGHLQEIVSALTTSPLSIGFIGAIWLYMFAPAGKPIPKKAAPAERARLLAERKERGRETGIRFALGGFFSWMSGQFVIDLLDTLFPWLHASKHPILFFFLLGSVGWYFGRGLWLLLERHKNKDLGESAIDAANVIKEIKK